MYATQWKYKLSPSEVSVVSRETQVFSLILPLHISQTFYHPNSQLWLQANAVRLAKQILSSNNYPSECSPENDQEPWFQAFWGDLILHP